MTNHSDELSACHRAPVKLVGGVGDFSDHEEGITMHYICTTCGKPCNIATHGDEELDEILQKFKDDHFEGFFGNGKPADAIRTHNEAKTALQTYVQQEVLKGRIDELDKARITWLKHTKDFMFDSSPETLKRVWNGMVDDRIAALKAEGATHD